MPLALARKSKRERSFFFSGSRRGSGPKIKITFVSKDAPLAIKIKKVLGAGTLEYPQNTDYLNLLIQDIPTLYKITVIINGKMRTPKIEALHRLIDWFNSRALALGAFCSSKRDLKDKENLLKLGVDISDLANNAWLSGFLEADGKFYCNFSMNTAGIANNIKYYMRISQKTVYIRKNDLTKSAKSEESFLPLMQTIADFLDVSKVNLIHRTKTNYIEEAF